MSIQFRSRIINFIPPQNAGGVLGFCCSTNTPNTFRSQCPGGVWIVGADTNTQCPTTGPCTSSFLSGGACCYWKYTDNNYIQLCEAATDTVDCYNKNEGESQNLHATYYAGRPCLSDGGDVVCNGIKNYTEDYSVCFPDGDTGCFDPTKLLGTCCNNGICDSTTKSECDGTWIPPKYGIVYGCNSTRCSSLLKTGTRTPPSITTETLTTTTQDLVLLPQIGEFYQGGIYVGTFTQYSGSGGSDLFGNPQTGTPHVYKTAPDITSESKTWILIADLYDYDSGILGITQDVNMIGSGYDGWYNTQSNCNISSLFNSLQTYTKNGFSDWYVPSRDELAFYFNNIKLDTPIYQSVNLSNGIYLTSTPYILNGTQKINYNYFVYSQSAYTETYGNVLLTNRRASGKVRLFRRIYVK